MADVIAGTSTRYTEIQQLSYTTVCVCVFLKFLIIPFKYKQKVQIEFH